jgi:hypothetical protein
MARKTQLPAGITPRPLSREAAAPYVGLSTGAFTAEVAAGTLPEPFLLRRTHRHLWDVRALDAVLDRKDGSFRNDESWPNQNRRIA